MSRVYASEGELLVHYDFDTTGPSLVRRASVALPAFVQAGCRHSTMELLYIASSKGGYAAEEPVEEHYLSTFRIEHTGALTQVGDALPLPHRPVYIALDRASSHVLVAYSDPPAITVHPLENDGRIGGDPYSPSLEMRHYPHQVVVSPSDDFVAVCCTGQVIDPEADPSLFRGAIHAFAYDNGRIGTTASTTAPNGGLGFSPRHLAFHPSLPLAFVSLERQNELHVYRYDSSGLDPEPLFRTTTLFAGGPSKGVQYAGTVRMHPSGRFVYVANRTLGFHEEDGKKLLTTGGDDIAVFEIDPQSGCPTPLERIDSEGVMPRTIATDPAGDVLVVANQFAVEAFDDEQMKCVPQSLVLYRIAADGGLTRAKRYELEMDQKPMIWMDVLSPRERAAGE